MQTLTTTIAANGQKYIETTCRGTEYTLTRCEHYWTVWTRRVGYGGNTHLGGCKTFLTLAEVQAKCKAFSGLDLGEVL